MSETLAQALRLTVLGMGMTFVSIGALALGMLAMTYLTTGRMRKDVGDQESDGRAEKDAGAAESLDSVAAAAVAVALADFAARQSDDAAQAAAAAVVVSLVEAEDAGRTRRKRVPQAEEWNSFVRVMHLSHRSRYESRRGS